MPLRVKGEHFTMRSTSLACLPACLPPTDRGRQGGNQTALWGRRVRTGRGTGENNGNNLNWRRRTGRQIGACGRGGGEGGGGERDSSESKELQGGVGERDQK